MCDEQCPSENRPTIRRSRSGRLGRRRSIETTISRTVEDLSAIPDTYQSWRSHTSAEAAEGHKLVKNYELRLQSHYICEIGGRNSSLSESFNNINEIHERSKQAVWKESTGHESFQLIERCSTGVSGDDSGATAEMSLSSWLSNSEINPESCDEQDNESSLSVICLSNAEDEVPTCPSKKTKQPRSSDRHYHSMSNFSKRNLPPLASPLDAKERQRLSLSRNRSKRHSNPSNTKCRRYSRSGERFSASVSELPDFEISKYSMSSSSASSSSHREASKQAKGTTSSNRRASKKGSAKVSEASQINKRTVTRSSTIRWERASRATPFEATTLNRNQRKPSKGRRKSKALAKISCEVVWERNNSQPRHSTKLKPKTAANRNSKTKKKMRRGLDRTVSIRSADSVHWERPASVNVHKKELSNSERDRFCTH